MLTAIIAAIPILWLIISLGVLKIPAHRACGLGLVLTGALAVLGLKMPVLDMGSAALEGGVIAVWPILIVITAAIFTYNLSLKTGSMDLIKRMLIGISDDRRIQVLILVWGFGGFLEAVAGYGTAVAIPAGILLALGVEPVLAAVVCLVANTAPTAFGAVGIPVLTLAGINGLSAPVLSFFVALQLLLIVLLIPFVLVWMISGTIRGIRGVFGITLASGAAFALPQLLIARFVGAELPALAGSVLSMAVIIWMAKRRPPLSVCGEQAEATTYASGDSGQENKPSGEGALAEGPVSPGAGLRAWSPYILTFLLALLTSPAVPFVSGLLGQVRSQLTLYTGEGAAAVTVKWISNVGVLMLLSAVIGGRIQGAGFREIGRVFASTLVQLKKSFVTVLSIVALSKIMSYSGMIGAMADVLVELTGSGYVFIAPFIGALGTFLTGSDTSANVLFGSLQMYAADFLGLDPYWLSAANTSGATAGKMISPQSIAVVTSATGLTGLEGKIFSRALKYCLLYLVLLGVIVTVFR